MSQGTVVRRTRPEDFPAITEICLEVYPGVAPWTGEQLSSHLAVFPEGQLFVEVDGEPAGMAASLIVLWEDYDLDMPWRDMTDSGLFTNHAPTGRTLYGAEVMVRPSMQGRGVGKEIYRVRREIAERLGLLRIRAGARLRDYHRYADRMSAEDYVRGILRGELGGDRTLSFQLKQHFHVLAVVSDYLSNDPASRGYAAVIEWINEAVATDAELRAGDRARARFA